MTDDTKGKFVSRFVALAFMALTFAGCFAALSAGEQPLLSDPHPTVMAER